MVGSGVKMYKTIYEYVIMEKELSFNPEIKNIKNMFYRNKN